MTILRDQAFSAATRAMMLGEPSGLPSRPDLAHNYWALIKATRTINRAIYLANKVLLPCGPFCLKIQFSCPCATVDLSHII